MIMDSRQVLYGEAARGRLGRFLDAHPDMVNAEVAEALSQDFRRAAEYGDLGTAVIAVRAGAEILDRIGAGQEAVRLQIDLLRLQVAAAGSVEEYTSLRDSALAVGARAQDRRWPAAQIECWLLAAECARRLADEAAPAHRGDYLIAALRDLADVSELVSEQPPGQQLHSHQLRLTEMLVDVPHAAYGVSWDESALLGLRALLKRAARASERIITRGITAEMFPDRESAGEADRRLLRLFREIDG
jgi:hypothetical protein